MVRGEQQLKGTINPKHPCLQLSACEEAVYVKTSAVSVAAAVAGTWQPEALSGQFRV